MQDVEIGNPAFDDAFVIKGNNEAKLRELFCHPEVSSRLLHLPDVSFEIRGHQGWFGPMYSDGVEELYFVMRGVERDLSRLHVMFDLFAATLDQLCRMDSAYAKDPGVYPR
jgi:hypothetical protein